VTIVTTISTPEQKDRQTDGVTLTLTPPAPFLWCYRCVSILFESVKPFRPYNPKIFVLYLVMVTLTLHPSAPLSHSTWILLNYTFVPNTVLIGVAVHDLSSRNIFLIFGHGDIKHDNTSPIIKLDLQVSNDVTPRAGTIWSAADTICIRYRPCRYDTYSTRYTCTRLKVSKSRILFQQQS